MKKIAAALHRALLLHSLGLGEAFSTLDEDKTNFAPMEDRQCCYIGGNKDARYLSQFSSACSCSSFNYIKGQKFRISHAKTVIAP